MTPACPPSLACARRGIRPQAVRHFVNRVGLAKANSQVDAELLDGSIREDLNFEAPRVMCVHRSVARGDPQSARGTGGVAGG